MTYYVQPQDPTWVGNSYGLSDTSGAGYAAALNAMGPGPAQNIVSSGGPQLDFSSPDDAMYYGGWDMTGNAGQQAGAQVDPWGGTQDLWNDTYNSGTDIAYGDWGAPTQQSGGIQYDPNVGYEYGSTYDPYGNGTGMNANYGYDYGPLDTGSGTWYDTSGQQYNPGYGYDTIDYYGGGGYGSTSNLDDLSNRYNTSITPLPRTGNQIDLQTGGIPRVSALGHGSSWTESRGGQPSTGRTPPRPPQAPSRSMPPTIAPFNAVPLPNVTPAPAAPNYNVMAQPHMAWDRLANFLDNPMQVLENDPQYQAMLSEGNRNRAAQHRRGRTRFSGTAGADFEKFGVEAANQNLDRIARQYGETARDELARWAPAAQLDFNRQTQGFGDSLDAWRAGTAADFQRYGLSQRDMEIANRINATNQGLNNQYYSDLGSQDMLNYMYNLQNFYGA